MEKLHSGAEDLRPEIDEDTSLPIEVQDGVVRLIGIPFFGIVIPSASGLIDVTQASAGEIFGAYMYFIGIAWIVWEGNRALVFRYYPVIVKSSSAIQKYTLFLGLNILYTVPVSMITLLLWKWTEIASVDNIQILVTTIIMVVCVIFVTNVYEKVLYAKENESEKIKIEQLERGKVLAELEALKNQIDPHFMFNALNSISYLIKHDQDQAEVFVQNLAEVYRYILSSKEKDLIPLCDEIAFMNAYAKLLSLRYETGFTLDLRFAREAGQSYLIPPVTLMVAIENAVKHNKVSLTNPLEIWVEMQDDCITLTNKRNARKSEIISTQIGLENLNDRFLKILGKKINIDQSDGFFSLSLPLLRL